MLLGQSEDRDGNGSVIFLEGGIAEYVYFIDRP
jgi:hypothetical protein